MTVPAHSSPAPGRFTDFLHDHTRPLRAAIDDLEFLRRLGDGTLPLDAFRTYIEQDALYLAGYSKALALLSAKSPDAGTGAFWATSAATAAIEESVLHDTLLSGGVLPPSIRADHTLPGVPGLRVVSDGDCRHRAVSGGRRRRAALLLDLRRSRPRPRSSARQMSSPRIPHTRTHSG